MDSGFYSVRDHVEQGVTQTANEVFIVNVGDGMSHNLTNLRRKQFIILSRFIFQVLFQVIEQISQPLKGIEAITHDFHTKQPINGKLYGRIISTIPLNAYMDF